MVIPSEPPRLAEKALEPRQSAVYRRYLHLQAIAEEHFSGTLAGHLLLCAGFGLAGAELAQAASICGGTFLGIESDAQLLKAALRSGACDFMVNTLDEALRVLKNELRKRTPLSVGLVGSSAEMLRTAVERGVQPDLIADTSTAEEAKSNVFQQMLEWGAEMLADTPEEFAANEVTWITGNLQDMRRLDKLALEAIPAQDGIRRRWMEQAPAYFHRHLPPERVVGLSSEERTRLIAALRNANSAAPFQQPVNVYWRDGDGVEQTISV